MPQKRSSNLVLSDLDDNDSDEKRIKAPKNEAKLPNLEEGEISSDALDDEEDDGLDENLIGGEEDKYKLSKMTEKEREEELFKRAERRDAMLARKAVKERLRLQKESKKSTRPKSGTNFDALFDSDKSENEDDDDLNSSFSKSRVQSRKNALERKKEDKNNTLKLLMQKRRMKQKLDSGSDLSSDDENADKDDKTNDKGKNHVKIYSDSDSVDSDDGNKQNKALSSGSSLESSDDDRDNRGRSRSPVEEMITDLQDIKRIRLSRHKLERWVHMPFFNKLVVGCFVRINIGLHQGMPVYRCVEVADVIESPKVYDLGNTRTNKMLVVKASKHQTNFRMSFVSNSEFTNAEFTSWMRKNKEDNFKLPTMSFVNRKSKEIEIALNGAINDDKVIEQIVQSKKRFQKQPTNFALKKAELLKLRDTFKLENNMNELRKVENELKDIDKEAEKIERKRTTGFKSIVTINQRNRMLSLQQAEEAIKREAKQSAINGDEDPYTRIQSRPIIWKKKNADAKTKTQEDTDAEAKAAMAKAEEEIKNTLASPVKAVPTHNPSSLHDIHDFEIDIAVDEMTSINNQNGLDTNKTGNKNQSVTRTTGSRDASSKRMLNLEEYKRRKGLI